MATPPPGRAARFLVTTALVDQRQCFVVPPGGREYLTKRGVDLRDQPRVAGLAREVRRLPRMGDAFAEPAEAVAHVAEPIGCARLGVDIADPARQFGGALEQADIVAQRQRVENAGHAELVDDQTPVQIAIATAVGEIVHRIERGLVMRARAIEREGDAALSPACSANCAASSHSPAPKL